MYITENLLKEQPSAEQMDCPSVDFRRSYCRANISQNEAISHVLAENKMEFYCMLNGINKDHYIQFVTMLQETASNKYHLFYDD